MKRTISVLLVLLMLLCAFGCGQDTPPANNDSEPTTNAADSDGNDESNESKPNTPSTPNADEPSGGGETELKATTYLLNSNTKGIKVLGERQLKSDIQFNCDWTCQGLEMNIVHEGGDIVFFANSSAACYFRAYIDGVEKPDADGNVYYTVDSANHNIVLKNVPKGEHTVRLIKVTGYTLARAELLSVKFAGTIKEEATADNDLYIEFIGASTNCGYGVLNQSNPNDGTYTAQDGTLAYSYKVAEELDADYSITALSGQGLLVGNPGMMQGYLYPSALRDKSDEYGFERKADVVIIAEGANDYNNRNGYDITEEDFKVAYKLLLETVRQKNGEDCKILCLYNFMNYNFEEGLLAAVEAFGGEDAGVYVIKQERVPNGKHANIAQHEAYTVEIVEKLQEILQLSEQ